MSNIRISHEGGICIDLRQVPESEFFAESVQGQQRDRLAGLDLSHWGKRADPCRPVRVR